MRVYGFWAVRANQASSWSAPKTRSSVPATITERGLFSTKRSKTLPSMMTSSRECVEKVSSVTSGEREHHLNGAGYRGKPCRHVCVAARAFAQFRQDIRVNLTPLIRDPREIRIVPHR